MMICLIHSLNAFPDLGIVFGFPDLFRVLRRGFVARDDVWERLRRKYGSDKEKRPIVPLTPYPGVAELYTVVFLLSQVRQIRKKMVDIMTREISSCDLKEVVNKLIPDSMSHDIAKACQGIYPLHDVHVRKVKVLKKPR